jgi:hypothetical protein
LNPSGSTDTPSLTACGARQGVKLNTDIRWILVGHPQRMLTELTIRVTSNPVILSTRAGHHGQVGISQKSPPADGRRASQPYLVGDPIPVPEVTELDTNSAWGLFEELAKAKPKSRLNPDLFAETVPAEPEPMKEKPKPVSPLK